VLKRMARNEFKRKGGATLINIYIDTRKKRKEISDTQQYPKGLTDRGNRLAVLDLDKKSWAGKVLYGLPTWWGLQDDVNKSKKMGET